MLIIIGPIGGKCSPISPNCGHHCVIFGGVSKKDTERWSDTTEELNFVSILTQFIQCVLKSSQIWFLSNPFNFHHHCHWQVTRPREYAKSATTVHIRSLWRRCARFTANYRRKKRSIGIGLKNWRYVLGFFVRYILFVLFCCRNFMFSGMDLIFGYDEFWKTDIEMIDHTDCSILEKFTTFLFYFQSIILLFCQILHPFLTYISPMDSYFQFLLSQFWA